MNALICNPETGQTRLIPSADVELWQLQGWIFITYEPTATANTAAQPIPTSAPEIIRRAVDAILRDTDAPPTLNSIHDFASAEWCALSTLVLPKWRHVRKARERKSAADDDATFQIALAVGQRLATRVLQDGGNQ